MASILGGAPQAPSGTQLGQRVEADKLAIDQVRGRLRVALVEYDDAAACELVALLIRAGPAAGAAIPELFDAYRHPYGRHRKTTELCAKLRSSSATAIRIIGPGTIVEHPASGRWLGMAKWEPSDISTDVEIAYSEKMLSSQTDLSWFAANRLADSGGARLQFIMTWLTSGDQVLECQAAKIAFGLGRKSMKWKDELEALSLREHTASQRWAVMALGALLPESRMSLVALMGAEDPAVRREAMLALNSSLGNQLAVRLPTSLVLGCGGELSQGSGPTEAERAVLAALESATSQQHLASNLQSEFEENKLLALCLAAKMRSLDGRLKTVIASLRGDSQAVVRTMARLAGQGADSDRWSAVRTLVEGAAPDAHDIALLLKSVTLEAGRLPTATRSAAPRINDAGEFDLPTPAACDEFHEVCRIVRSYGAQLLNASAAGGAEETKLLDMFESRLQGFGRAWLAAASYTGVDDRAASEQLAGDGCAIMQLVAAGWLWGTSQWSGGCDSVVLQQLGPNLARTGSCATPFLMLGLEHPDFAPLAGEYLANNLASLEPHAQAAGAYALIWAWRKSSTTSDSFQHVGWEDTLSASMVIRNPFNGEFRPMTWVEIVCRNSGPGIAPTLMAGMEDPCPIVRERCCWGLGAIVEWNASVLEGVLQHMDADEPRVRLAAAAAVAQHSESAGTHFAEAKRIWELYAN